MIDEKTKAAIRAVAGAQALRLFKRELVGNDDYTCACYVGIVGALFPPAVLAGATYDELFETTFDPIVIAALRIAGFMVTAQVLARVGVREDEEAR